MGITDAFFALLRSGLEGTDAEKDLLRGLTAEQWYGIYRMAESQALLGIVFDGISSTDWEIRPPRELILRWMEKVVGIEKMNGRLNSMVERLNSVYESAGMKPVLLKGQGVAELYRIPAHRQCGDIDIYLGKAGQKTGNRMLEGIGAEKKEEESEKHASFLLDGVMIENHRIMCTMNNPLHDRRLQKMVEAWYPNGAVNNGRMAVPPPTFNAMYVFIHAFTHFIEGGVGLRQLCDWYCILKSCNRDIDGEKLTADLKRLGLMKAAKAFGYVIVNKLGLPAEFMPFDTRGSEKDGEMVLKEILASGNFGRYDTRIPGRPKGYWRGKWFTFKRVIKRAARFYSLAPTELMWYPYHLISNFIRAQYSRIKL